MKVYIVPNLNKLQAAKTAVYAAKILRDQGAEVLFETAVQSACPLNGAHYLSCHQCHEQADAIVTIGGDGTILHEANQALGYRKPILGVNLGRCGFLATCEESELETKLALLAKGRYHVDTRVLLYARVLGDRAWNAHALNDVVVAKGRLQQAIEFSIYCDDIPVEHYRGDGVIIATPTGSTAYSLAAGGPILDSQTEAMVVTPICPHSLNSPAIVFAPERKISIRVGPVEGDEVFVSADGYDGYSLHTGSVVEIKVSDQHVQLVTFGKADQFQAIDQKLRNRS